jgi:Na+/melibiose symporter-like transporter
MAGAIVVAYLSGFLVEKFGARNVFLITGSLPLLTSLFALLIDERPSEPDMTFSFKDTWQSIRSALTPALLWSIAFLFIWRATPTSGGALSYFLIDELHFTPEFFGRLALVSYVTAIVGIVVFRKLLLSLPLKWLFFWIVILSIVLSLPSLGLVYGWYRLLGVSPQFFAVADTAISGALTEIAFLPLLVLAARLCPKGIEATMFAILASIMNIGLAVSDLGGAWLVSLFSVHQATATLPADYTHLSTVMWIAILSSVLPLPLLPFLPETRTTGERTEDISPSSKAPGIGGMDPLKQEIT